MELRHLRYFVAAAEEEHFGRGATRANVVQPALTRAVHELEREITILTGFLGLGMHRARRLQ